MFPNFFSAAASRNTDNTISENSVTQPPIAVTKKDRYANLNREVANNSNTDIAPSSETDSSSIIIANKHKNKPSKQTQVSIDNLVAQTKDNIEQRIKDTNPELNNTNEDEVQELSTFGKAKNALGVLGKVIAYVPKKSYQGINSALIYSNLIKSAHCIPASNLIATALYLDKNDGKIKAYDEMANSMLNIAVKSGFNLPEIKSDQDLPIVIELYEDGEEAKTSFKKKTFLPFAKFSAVEETIIKSPTAAGEEQKYEKYTTQESFIYTATKFIINKGKSAFGEHVEMPTIILEEGQEVQECPKINPYELLAENKIRIHTNEENGELASNLEQVINGSSENTKDMRAKLSATKILSMASGEQIDFKELSFMIAIACGIGVAGEFAAEAIKHAVENKMGHGIGPMIASGIVRGASVGAVDILENGINGWANNSQELKKRGIEKIDMKAIFGSGYENYQQKNKLQKAQALLMFAIGKIEASGAKGEAAQTISNALLSALKGGAAGAGVSLLPMIALSRDYKNENPVMFAAINMLCSAIAASGTGLSLPIELRNIMDRTTGALNHVFTNGTLTIPDDVKNDPEKIKNFVKSEQKETITTSVVSKSSMKAYSSVGTLGLLWLLHKKVSDALSDKAVQTLHTVFLPPWENILRSAVVFFDDGRSLSKSIKNINTNILNSIASEQEIDSKMVQNELSGPIVRNVLYPAFNAITKGFSNAKHLFKGEQPRNNINYANPNIDALTAAAIKANEDKEAEIEAIKNDSTKTKKQRNKAVQVATKYPVTVTLDKALQAAI